jgi:hypothetical protein
MKQVPWKKDLNKKEIKRRIWLSGSNFMFKVTLNKEVTRYICIVHLVVEKVQYATRL